MIVNELSTHKVAQGQTLTRFGVPWCHYGNHWLEALVARWKEGYEGRNY